MEGPIWVDVRYLDNVACAFVFFLLSLLMRPGNLIVSVFRAVFLLEGLVFLLDFSVFSRGLFIRWLY